MQREYTLEDIDEVAQKAVSCMETKLYLFEGKLGAGKTTLAKAIGKQLGVVDKMKSPSFAIINEHVLPNQKRLCHIDLYRIGSIDELDELGLEEVIDSSICLIEWPRYHGYFLPYSPLYITISFDEYLVDIRRISCSSVMPLVS